MKRPLPIETTMRKSAITAVVNRTIFCPEKKKRTYWHKETKTLSTKVMFSTSRGPNTKTQNRPNAGPRNSISFRLIRWKGYSIFYNFEASAVAETNHKCLFLCLKVTWQKQGNARISNHRASQQLSNGAFGSKLNLRVPICAGLSFDNFFTYPTSFWKLFRNTTLPWLYIRLSDFFLTTFSHIRSVVDVFVWRIRHLFRDFFSNAEYFWQRFRPTNFDDFFLQPNSCCRLFLASDDLFMTTVSRIRCYFDRLGKAQAPKRSPKLTTRTSPPNPYPLG